MAATSYTYRSRCTRRGMTLIELLLAALMTAFISAAAAAMLNGASNASYQSRNARTVTAAGHYAEGRIGAVIRQARGVGKVSSNRISLWVADSNDDDKVQLSEAATITYDASAKVICINQTVASSATVVSSAIFQDVDQLDTAITGAGAKATQWAEDVQACVFEGYPSNTDTRIVNATFTIATGSDAMEFGVTASPKASADYLFQTGTRTAPSGAETRYKRAKVSPYMGASTAQ